MGIQNLEIAKRLEELAPLTLAEKWDNCGWQVFCGRKEINSILVTLTVTPEVVKKAVREKFNLIVSHHPVIFKGLDFISPETLPGKVILEAIKADISIYASHTNLDKVSNGVSDILARKLGLKNIVPLVPEKNQPEVGLGRVGDLEEVTELYQFIDKIKEVLNTEKIKVINQPGIKNVRTIALCGGSGASLSAYLTEEIDLYLTGDVKYHDALEALDFVLVDAHHTATEDFMVEELVNYLKQPGLTVAGTKSENPWQIY